MRGSESRQQREESRAEPLHSMFEEIIGAWVFLFYIFAVLGDDVAIVVICACLCDCHHCLPLEIIPGWVHTIMTGQVVGTILTHGSSGQSVTC